MLNARRNRMRGDGELGMPDLRRTRYPWVNEDSKCAWYMRMSSGENRLIKGGKCEEKGAVAVQMLDRKRHVARLSMKGSGSVTSLRIV